MRQSKSSGDDNEWPGVFETSCECKYKFHKRDRVAIVCSNESTVHALSKDIDALIHRGV